MWRTPMLGTDIYHVIHWFIIYSMLGWAAESIYMSICNRKITNRGFMKGPFCPIYGFGALTVFFILRPFSSNYIVLYLCGAFLATTFELLVAKLMTVIFGDFWWDYQDKPFNYKGMLCLESSLGWGLYTVLMFGFLHRFVVWLVARYPMRYGVVAGRVVLLLVAIDAFMSVYAEKKEFFNDGFDEIRERLKRFRLP